MTSRTIVIGLGIGLAGAAIGAAIAMRRASTMTLLGQDFGGRLDLLEGRVDVLEDRMTHGMSLMSSFGARLEFLEQRRPEIQYVVQRERAVPPPAPRAQPVQAPVAGAYIADTARDYIEAARRRFSLVELN